MEERNSAPHVARPIGIKTHTLAKWRQVSPTHVTYPRSEVEKSLAERAAQTPARA